MYIQRAARHLRPNPFTTTRTSVSRYASSSQQTDESDKGASGKTTEKAQPKILGENPKVEESEQSEDVRKHNAEMDARAERQAQKGSDKEIKDDKVHKGFWGGERATEW